jgi:putative transposase
MVAAVELAPKVGVKAACAAMKVARATFYRRRLRRQPSEAPKAPRKATISSSPRALSDAERSSALEVLRSERFVDKAPRQIYAELLDEGTYICSPRTFYRILHAELEVRDRRNQRRHPQYAKPELLATAPNLLWSWDITKLRGLKGFWYHLYVILDVFSRYVVGWMVAHRERAQLAERLITEACLKQSIPAKQLTIHADRGAAMTSKSVTELMVDLSITQSHSRPQVSNDNPFSEAQFKTLKYHPTFPDRFGSMEDARAYCGPFFSWYNNEHCHSGIAYVTPATVHYGRVDQALQARQQTLDEAYLRSPHRFTSRPPLVQRPPAKVWINPPSPPAATAETPRAKPTGGHDSDSRPLLCLSPLSSSVDERA